ncbi:hypothetical protein [Aliiroseovarius lamellibrachiae]|uniref:hypothetical protein n=1 Tax=Aliiroseovarius lamellibrachiae TaxID=1924933 RepID=UPI001BE0B2DD|nr:hypothetical protein [Aliiroseovarius lamellibrachiae]MBT2130685.1 hypothetical protein [Aliiroseovarius lamellibrachiae]
MFWNAAWNESLFLVSLSERLMGTESDHSLRELTARIRCEIAEQIPSPPTGTFWQFRLIFMDRDGDQVTRHITYQSDLIRLHPHEF